MSEQAQPYEKFSTLGDYLNFANEQFEQAHLCYEHGTGSAWDDAVFLVLRTLGLPPDANQSVLDMPITEQQAQRLRANIDLRITKKIPTPYIVQETWFAGWRFYVDERVIIPRSPIAELIENQFQPWLLHEPKKMLDMCTGGGCIAIACALSFPSVQQIDAVDLSPAALEVADINVKSHGVTARVNLVESDLFANITDQYDLIVSNPPYVSEEEVAALPDEFHYEPSNALLGGDHDGLALPVKILQQAVNYLNDDGILVLEVGYSESALCERYPNAPFTWLEFEHGGQGVLVITKEQLRDLT